MDYLIKLYIDYCYSMGKKVDIRNIVSDNEFINWVIGLKRKTKIYESFLEYLGIILTRDSAIELSKGKYDSLENVTKISLYREPKSSLQICGDTLVVVQGNTFYDASCYTFFLTHNNLEIEDIMKLVKLHKLGMNIILGMYGSVQDFDMLRKLNVLEKLSDELNHMSLCIERYNGNYFACIKDKEMIKRRVLRR